MNLKRLDLHPIIITIRHTSHIWVQVNIICMHMVLDNMLVYPRQGTATNPVLGDTKDPIYDRIFGHCAIVGIMLNVET